MEPSKQAKGSRVAICAHAALIVFACVFWGAFADIDAPFVYHPDEPDVVGRAVTMLVTGDLNPHWFHYPTLPIYLYAAVFKALGLFVDIPLELGVFVKVTAFEKIRHLLKPGFLFVIIGTPAA